MCAQAILAPSSRARVEMTFCGSLWRVAWDGQDCQDDYTLPIEKNQWRKSLDSILRSSYAKDRGVSDDEVEIKVKFLLPQAGAGLGWLDSSKSPLQLKLKDGGQRHCGGALRQGRASQCTRGWHEP
ncbi:unnamed protein product [Durusdinium trenchii]|uniref:Uncharacterized protein n=1 Tax=Durusdinium trenchii TaxID=1381693 RepID=A0ABP0M3L1_9DINO